jgi:hypothetical protein
MATAAALLAAIFAGWQAWIARDTERQQLRAYVSLSFTTTRNPEAIFYNGTATTDRFGQELTITDNGNTPAHDVVVSGKLKILPFPLGDSDLNTDQTDEINDMPAYPGNTQLTASFYDTDPIVKQDIDDTHGDPPTKAFYLYGTITYLDIFNTRHTNHFCYWQNNGMTTFNQDRSIDTIWWTQCDRYNDFN